MASVAGNLAFALGIGPARVAVGEGNSRVLETGSSFVGVHSAAAAARHIVGPPIGRSPCSRSLFPPFGWMPYRARAQVGPAFLLPRIVARFALILNRRLKDEGLEHGK